MGAKDRKANEYFADNRRFADMCNAVLFGGRTVILPEALEATDTTELLSVLGMDGKRNFVSEVERFIKTCYNQEKSKCLSGFDWGRAAKRYSLCNAGKGHGLCWVKLWGTGQGGWKTTQKGKRKRNGEQNQNFCQGFTGMTPLTPVITITVYLGAEAWDESRSLHEMFGTLDEELKPWIPDYRINLLAPQEIEDFSVFRTEVGQLLQFIRASESEQEVQKLLGKYPEKFSRLDSETVAAICLFTGIEIACEDEKEVVDLCKAWEEHRETGLREGRETGRREERISSIRNMVELGVPKEKNSYQIYISRI